MELVRHVLARVLVGVMVAFLVACSDDVEPVPSELVDGSAARPPPVMLEDVGDSSISTRVTTGDSSRASLRAAACLRSFGVLETAPIVERVGVHGTSVTYVDAGRRAARACDAAGTAWCGRAFGRLVRGRLTDPRLSLSCTDPDGLPVAFAWVQPGSAARYVVVDQPGYAEVYGVMENAPVRVTSSDVDLAASSATFAIGEHARDGRRLRSYVLEARVAG